MGRTPTFKNEEEFESIIARYLTDCESKQRMPNIAGACVEMDIGRTQFYEYCKKFPNTKRRFEAHIENAWVSRLSEPGATGAIFYLKNKFRKIYKDKQETDITSGNKPIQPLLVKILDEKGDGDTSRV